MMDERRQLGGDFRDLAGRIGMSTQKIRLISQKENPTEEVITFWETRKEAAVDKLIEIMRLMKREDVVSFLEGELKSGT